MAASQHSEPGKRASPAKSTKPRLSGQGQRPGMVTCKGTNKKGFRCRHTPLLNGDYCNWHDPSGRTVPVCEGINTKGTRCGQSAIRGAKFCRMHHPDHADAVNANVKKMRAKRADDKSIRHLEFLPEKIETPADVMEILRGAAFLVMTGGIDIKTANAVATLCRTALTGMAVTVPGSTAAAAAKRRVYKFNMGKAKA